MSAVNNTVLKCAVCEKEGVYDTVNEVSSQGFMDLDTRPAGIARHKFHEDIKVCLNCGYTSNDIQNASITAKTSVRSNVYLTILHNPEINEISKKFYLNAHIKENEQDFLSAGMSYLSAAWAHDDIYEIDLAIFARTQAIVNLEKHLNQLPNLDKSILLLDLYRRTKKYEKCIASAKTLLKSGIKNKFLKRIVKYEIKLSKKQDSTTHTVKQCI